MSSVSSYFVARTESFVSNWANLWERFPEWNGKHICRKWYHKIVRPEYLWEKTQANFLGPTPMLAGKNRMLQLLTALEWLLDYTWYEARLTFKNKRRCESLHSSPPFCATVSGGTTKMVS